MNVRFDFSDRYLIMPAAPDDEQELGARFVEQISGLISDSFAMFVAEMEAFLLEGGTCGQQPSILFL